MTDSKHAHLWPLFGPRQADGLCRGQGAIQKLLSSMTLSRAVEAFAIGGIGAVVQAESSFFISSSCWAGADCNMMRAGNGYEAVVNCNE